MIYVLASASYINFQSMSDPIQSGLLNAHMLQDFCAPAEELSQEACVGMLFHARLW